LSNSNAAEVEENVALCQASPEEMLTLNTTDAVSFCPKQQLNDVDEPV
jgi:hypothetical protein